MLASVVGAYYYLRLVKIMFFDDAKTAFLPVDRGAGIVMTLSGAFVLLFVFILVAAGQRGAPPRRWSFHVATAAAAAQ